MVNNIAQTAALSVPEFSVPNGSQLEVQFA